MAAWVSNTGMLTALVFVMRVIPKVLHKKFNPPSWAFQEIAMNLKRSLKVSFLGISLLLFSPALLFIMLPKNWTST